MDDKPNAYAKFAEMLNSLSDIIPDKAMCYAAALEAVCKSYRIDAEQILSAMDGRLKSLEKEGDKYSKMIEQSETELAKYDRLLKEKDQMAETLKKQLTSIEVEKIDIEKTLNQKRANIEAKSKEFSQAANSLRDKMEKEKRSFIKYLKRPD